MGNSPSRLTAPAPSRREPLDKEGKFPARTKASLLEGGGTAIAVTEGVGQQSLEKLELMKMLIQKYFA